VIAEQIPGKVNSSTATATAGKRPQTRRINEILSRVVRRRKMSHSSRVDSLGSFACAGSSYSKIASGNQLFKKLKQGERRVRIAEN
jgi:hypothetical protein